MNKKTKYCNIENDLFRFFTIIIRKELIENKWSYFLILIIHISFTYLF